MPVLAAVGQSPDIAQQFETRPRLSGGVDRVEEIARRQLLRFQMRPLGVETNSIS